MPPFLSDGLSHRFLALRELSWWSVLCLFQASRVLTGRLGAASPARAPLLLGGPSGVGKTTFARWLETHHGWLHLDADLHGVDGIDALGLRREWTSLWTRHNPRPLLAEFRRRARQHPGLVMTLPSTVVFDPGLLPAWSPRLRIRYLWGAPDLCLRSFLDRETLSNRRLPETHWHQHNRQTYQLLADPRYRAYLLPAFAPDGSRRPPEALFSKLFPG